MSKKPEVPKHLKPASAAFWQRVQSDYQIIDPAGERLLTSACECLDRAAQAREVIDKSGLVYTDRFDAPRQRPEVNIERNALLAFSRILKVLGLDLAPPTKSGAK